jgi:hypothetical protein
MDDRLDPGLLSLNVKGQRDYRKCRKIFNWVIKHGGDRGVAFLQETHITTDHEIEWSHRLNVISPQSLLHAAFILEIGFQQTRNTIAWIQFDQ